MTIIDCEVVVSVGIIVTRIKHVVGLHAVPLGSNTSGMPGYSSYISNQHRDTIMLTCSVYPPRT